MPGADERCGKFRGGLLKGAGRKEPEHAVIRERRRSVGQLIVCELSRADFPSAERSLFVLLNVLLRALVRSQSV
jgi:hypothetical protein